MEELDAPIIPLGKNKEQTHDEGVFMLELWTNILDKSDRYSRVMIFEGILTRDSLNRWATSFLKHTSLFRSWLWHFAHRPFADSVRSGWARLNWDVVCQIVRVSTYKCKIFGIQGSLSTSTFFLLNPKTQKFLDESSLVSVPGVWRGVWPWSSNGRIYHPKISPNGLIFEILHLESEISNSGFWTQLNFFLA